MRTVLRVLEDVEATGTVYRERSVEDIEVSDEEGTLLVPAGMTVGAYLQSRYPDRVHGKGSWYSNINWIVFRHPVANPKSLEELMRLLRVHDGIVIAGDQPSTKLLGDLSAQGLGQWDFGDSGAPKRNQAFYNGLVFSSLPKFEFTNDRFMRARIDPKKAKRVLNGCKRKRTRKPSVRKPKLRVGAVYRVGAAIRDTFWDTMDLDVLLDSCIGGSYTYKTLKAKSWDQAFYSVSRVYEFVSRNRVDLTGRTFKSKLKNYGVEEPEKLIPLIDEHVKKLKAKKLPPEHASYVKEDKELALRVLRRMKRDLKAVWVPKRRGGRRA